MKEKELLKFMEKNMQDKYEKYEAYQYNVKKMLLNIYSCCFRFNLYNGQIVYILEQALKPFEEENIFDLF